MVKDGKPVQRKPVDGPTVNRELALISHLFTHFQVSPDPTKKAHRKGKVSLRFTEHPHIRFLERDEIGRLLAYAIDYQRPIIKTALLSGFSVSDILALTWDRINFTRRTITLSRMKTDVPMMQPMTNKLVKVLQAVPRHVSSPYVFCDAEGNPYKRIVKGFTAAVKRAGIKDFHFHDLRHTFASHYLMEGGDLKTLQVLLGHKSIVTTAKYAHFIQQHLGKEIQRIDNLFGGGTDDTRPTTEGGIEEGGGKSI